MEKKKENITKTGIYGVAVPIILLIAAAWIFIVSASFMYGRHINWGLSYLLELQGEFELVRFLGLCLRYLISIVFFTGTIIGTHFIGDKILALFKLEFKSVHGRAIISIGLGTGVLSLLMFAFALAGLLYSALIYSLWALGVFFGFKNIKKVNMSLSLNIKEYSGWEKVCLIMIAGIFLFNLIMAFTPEIFYDSLNYHLGVPNIYLQAGHYVELPFKFHSSFPLIPQMSFLFMIMIDSTAGAKLLNMAFTFLTAAAVYVFSRDRVGAPKAGLYAAVIYLFVPNVLFRTWTATTDTMLTFFTFLSLWALINFFIEKNNKWIILSAIFGGFFMGSKLTGAFAVVGICALILIASRKSFKKAFKRLILWGGVTLLVFMPWLARNFIETGNPFHPFFSTRLSTKYPYDMLDQSSSLESGMSEFTETERFKSLLFLPWTLSTQGGRPGGSYASADYYMPGALFLIFIPILIVFKGDPKRKKILAYLGLFSVFTFIVWAIQDEKVKYFALAFPALSILAGIGIQRMSLSGALGKVLALGTLIFHLTVNFLFMATMAHALYMPASLTTGALSRDEFLSQTRTMYPAPSFSVFEYVHDNLPEDINIIVSGDAKTYHLDRPHISFAPSQISPLLVYINEEGVENARDIYHLINEDEFTHLIYNAPEALRTAGYGYMDLNREEVTILEEFFNRHLNLLYTDNGVFLYEIVEFSEESVENPFLQVFVIYHQNAASNLIERALSEGRMKRRRQLLENSLERSYKIIDSGLKVARAYYYASYANYLLGKTDRAIEYARDAVMVDPGYEGYHEQLMERERNRR